MSSTFEAVSKSFENSLDQLEYFHSPFKLSREKICSDQAVIDRKIISLWK